MKILCVLYDDPKGGMPKNYPLNSIPKLNKYPDGKSKDLIDNEKVTKVFLGN